MDKQTKTVRNIMMFVYFVGVAILIIVACNSCSPVKRVLNDEYKMRKVWNEGALQGWCVNDTLIVNTSDTLITLDTLYSLDIQNTTDTFTVDREVVKVKTVTKTVRITDTIVKVVTDNSRINLLQKQLNISNDKGLELSRENEVLKEAASEFKGERNKWRSRFFLLLIIFGLFLFRKPLFKLAIRIISPLKF